MAWTMGGGGVDDTERPRRQRQCSDDETGMHGHAVTVVTHGGDSDGGGAQRDF